MASGSELDTETLLNDLHKWVSAETLRKKNIEKYDLKVYGADEKAEHYGSDIAFVDITAENFDGDKREYSLVIKYGQMMKALRDKLPIRDGFEREIDIYTKVVPAFHRFQQEKNLPVFNSIPKCFLSKFTATEEVIILENLKRAGFSIHKRQIPMDLNHMKFVLRAYAEWHALSFAFKHQKKDEFDSITHTWINNPMKDFVCSGPGKLINVGQKNVYNILRNLNEIDLLNEYRSKTGDKDFVAILVDLLNNDEPQSVILHGDCWNSNFLFKYEDDDTEHENCTKVALLDFQMSSINSPVFDLSQFIYSCTSEEGLSQFDLMLDFYYDHFANYLLELGTDPSVFTRSDLTAHWKKYAIYGALLCPMILMFVLVDKNNTPEFDKDNYQDVLNTSVQKDEYRSRVVAVARHFVEHFEAL
ncbi:hypothetical protein GWI33_015306 [Rhynchophorus ferrugineus]|uniref:CHK kinase-like domain-containing protein n=1 Tax=Rhynchophorus ferrugineus TaxID=354439 RepID=A0A834M4L3_RHYFE|nr:hypothetical protein GWI33_015306 [Rhynchophorus ferrugineus]